MGNVPAAKPESGSPRLLDMTSAPSAASSGGLMDVEEIQVSKAFAFWRDNVATLERAQLEILGLLLMSSLFKRSTDARALYATTDVRKHGMRLLDMFGWLIRTLDGAHSEMHTRTLKQLGEKHILYGVKPEFFKPMVDALGEALGETFEVDEFTPEIGAAVRMLFMEAAKSMRIPMESESKAASSEPLFLRSLQLALADPMGFQLMTAYLYEVAHRPQLAEFHRAFQIYRSTLDDVTRSIVADELLRVFFDKKSTLLIEGCETEERSLKAKLTLCKSRMEPVPLEAFDGIHEWLLNELGGDIWRGFQEFARKQAAEALRTAA